MPYSGVNNAGRADEGILARWFRDINGSLTASGESNAFAVSSNRTIAALANNTLLTFTANHAITGPATLNLNGLGDKPIRRFNGQPLAQGDIVSGQPVSVIFKTALDYWFMTTAPAAIIANEFTDYSETNPTNPVADVARVYAKADSGGATTLAFKDGDGFETTLRRATQDDMEAMTAARTPTPAVQHHHPGHPKFWLSAWARARTPTIRNDYGVASIVDYAAGSLGIVFDVAFSSADYAVVVSAETNTIGNWSQNITTPSQTATSISVYNFFPNAIGDPQSWHVMGAGDQ